MQHKRGASRMGYHAHYVVDGGKARVILQALVTPADVTENQPMLDLLFRTRFRWRARVRRVTGDAKYGTKENIAVVEKAGLRAYVSMADFEKKSPYYGASRFHYDAEQDLYRCPRGKPLRLYTHSYTERLTRYRADPESCNACPLKPECTPGGSGHVLMRSFDEELLERVRAYRGTTPYEKALRKRRVWVEPMFAEAKEWHGMRRFRLRTLRRVNVEALVIAAGQNIKRLLTFSGRGPRKMAQVEALRPSAPTPSANSRLLRSSHRRRSTPLLASFSTRWFILRSCVIPCNNGIMRAVETVSPPRCGRVRKEDIVSPESVTSNDGTPIAYWLSGEGPPLVLIHGTAADHGRWSPVLPAFEQRFTVCAVDRRGRGGSGDSDAYAIEREFEDVAAVADFPAEPVVLVGHSYGALLALEAALITRNVRMLVLYDPGIEVAGEEIYPHEVIERLDALLEAGDRDGVVATTMREVAGLPPETVEYMRSLPVWQARVEAAHTIPRELRAVKAYRLDPERFEDVRVPTLALSGGDSPAALRKAGEAVEEALADSRLVVMEGQGHAAMDTGTDLFTTEVIGFVEGP
jgi:pimeloyl-ACP methyl ester carboxylesterase